MIPIRRAASVRACDAAVVGLGLPGRVLMETAGRAAAVSIHLNYPEGKIAVLCGPGNNGGDGYVVARWLQGWGREVVVWSSAPPRTPDALANQQLWAVLGSQEESLDDALEGCTVGIDALLGTGHDTPPRGAIADAIAALAELPGVVALDLPTGVHADTGQAMGDAVVADLTVTFGALKPGLLCEP
ncbi:MAG: NAD(P)H-hydrate epimerase, partial [Myxococcota bacterium]|nr:NAD(P)H-hydrate epimerase [Myxococcota bacterium]